MIGFCEENGMPPKDKCHFCDLGVVGEDMSRPRAETLLRVKIVDMNAVHRLSVGRCHSVQSNVDLWTMQSSI